MLALLQALSLCVVINPTPENPRWFEQVPWDDMTSYLNNELNLSQYIPLSSAQFQALKEMQPTNSIKDFSYTFGLTDQTELGHLNALIFNKDGYVKPIFDEIKFNATMISDLIVQESLQDSLKELMQGLGFDADKALTLINKLQTSYATVTLDDLFLPFNDKYPEIKKYFLWWVSVTNKQDVTFEDALNNLGFNQTQKDAYKNIAVAITNLIESQFHLEPAYKFMEAFGENINMFLNGLFEFGKRFMDNAVVPIKKMMCDPQQENCTIREDHLIKAAKGFAMGIPIHFADQITPIVELTNYVSDAVKEKITPQGFIRTFFQKDSHIKIANLTRNTLISNKFEKTLEGASSKYGYQIFSAIKSITTGDPIIPTKPTQSPSDVTPTTEGQHSTGVDPVPENHTTIIIVLSCVGGVVLIAIVAVIVIYMRKKNSYMSISDEGFKQIDI